MTVGQVLAVVSLVLAFISFAFAVVALVDAHRNLRRAADLNRAAAAKVAEAQEFLRAWSRGAK